MLPICAALLFAASSSSPGMTDGQADLVFLPTWSSPPGTVAGTAYLSNGATNLHFEVRLRSLPSAQSGGVYSGDFGVLDGASCEELADPAIQQSILFSDRWHMADMMGQSGQGLSSSQDQSSTLTLDGGTNTVLGKMFVIADNERKDWQHANERKDWNVIACGMIKPALPVVGKAVITQALRFPVAGTAHFFGTPLNIVAHLSGLPPSATGTYNVDVQSSSCVDHTLEISEGASAAWASDANGEAIIHDEIASTIDMGSESAKGIARPFIIRTMIGTNTEKIGCGMIQAFTCPADCVAPTTSAVPRAVSVNQYRRLLFARFKVNVPKVDVPEVPTPEECPPGCYP
jgi:hypothetical protein